MLVNFLLRQAVFKMVVMVFEKNVAYTVNF